ncbi:MAG: sigma-54-dependent transcriptional regulator [Myxococcota bacterium]
MGQILVVSDEKDERERLCVALRRQGHEVEVARCFDDGLAIARERWFDWVVSDADLPEASGFELVRALKQLPRPPRVVVLSGRDSVEEAVEAMRQGSDDYLCKAAGAEAIARVLERDDAAGYANPHSDGALPAGRCERRAGDPFSGIIGRSLPLRETLELVRRVARTDSTVLIHGETGTGKELIGAAIHAASPRHGRIFSAVNAATFPETLLESELFGHRRGSFTGASSNKKGLFEHAHQGTVFLDEVAEMPLTMQAKLLRFLQTGEIRPLGSESTRIVDVRLVAASNKDLEEEVAAGRFREDLYYRLAVIPIEVPPLRERREDIPLLTEHFLREFERKHHRAPLSIDPEAMDVMLAYSWPGNVRELQNWIERAAALCSGRTITVSDVPRRLRERARAPESNRLESLQVLERSHILNTLECVGWNRKRAAEILEISTTTLWRRLKQFGIDVPPAANARRI